MKLIKPPLFQMTFVVLCLQLAGCAPQRVVEPLSNGYEQVAHPTRFSLNSPETMRISLEYRKPDGKSIVVWPSLYGVNEVIKGDLVIFVGDRAYLHPNTDTPRGSTPRLFAARTPGMPLDITDEILWRWSKASGKDFTQTLQQFSLASPTERNGRLELHLVFANYDRDWPDTVIQLDWSHVSDIIREVKERGTVHQDARWHTPYLEKEF